MCMSCDHKLRPPVPCCIPHRKSSWAGVLQYLAAILTIISSPSNCKYTPHCAVLGSQ